MTQIILTILITENIFLIFALIIWLNRHCKKCQQVKCIERIFNKVCRNCQDQKNPTEKKTYEL